VAERAEGGATGLRTETVVPRHRRQPVPRYDARTSWWRVLKLAEVPERPRSDYTERVADELDLDRALARLSREQRALLFLRYRLDLAPSEIAEVLSLRPGTVKSRLHRGLRRLQADMTIPFPEDAR
jgi:RNA polymerase sigma factor (sigma-70 family)